MTNLSVIIPVSRSAKNLSACLDSLAAQEVPSDVAIEIVLVGQGEDAPLCPAGLRIKYVRDDQASPSARRNKGVRLSSGDILCFIDDDVRVPPHWAKTIGERLTEHPDEIIGGPNKDSRSSFRYRLPAAVESCLLTEGLSSHRALAPDVRKEVGIHDLPLCNVAFRREVFDRVGGFNDEVSYFIDDVEFHYIARRLGYKLVLYSDLAVQHNSRVFFWPYCSYKWHTRRQIGKIFPAYACLYLDALPVKMILVSYVIVPLLFVVGIGPFLPVLAGVYGLAVVLAAASRLRDFPVFVGMLITIPLVHLVVYLGFTVGLISALVNIPQIRKEVAVKKRRFSVDRA